MTLQKSLAHGVSIQANYTWQKSIDNVPPSSGGTGASIAGGGSNPPIPWYLPGNRQLDTGLSDFNRQHVFVVSYLWDLPKPPTTNRFVTAVLGSWELTGIVSAESGLPFSVYAGKDISQTALNTDRGVYVGGDPLGNNACHNAPCVSWLNPSAFVLPAAGTVGNMGKGALVGPGLFNWDMEVFKNIRITERWRTQLRGEFFNTFNHANFTSTSNNYPNQSVNSAGFGTITSAYDPRILQLALKVFFSATAKVRRQSGPTLSSIGVLYEHPEWFKLLFSEFDRRAIAWSPIHAESLAYDPEHPVQHGLVLNRMSPSSSGRGHGNGIFAVRDFLWHLEHNGVDVVNGSAA